MVRSVGEIEASTVVRWGVVDHEIGANGASRTASATTPKMMPMLRNVKTSSAGSTDVSRRRVVSSQGCDEIVGRVGAIMPEQHGINSGLGFARCEGMTAFGYIAALSMIGAILVASTSFTDRRSVKTWAPSTVVPCRSRLSPRQSF